jgi:hypothetical protein
MARTVATNFTGGLQFPYATAAADIFKKEDVQTLALAVDQHDHTTGKGLLLPAGAIPAGSITSAMIADGTIVAADIADGSITTAKLAGSAVTQLASAAGSTVSPGTTSGSLVDIPDMAATMTTVGGLLLCWFTVELQTDGTGAGGVIGFNMDGVDSISYHVRFGNAGLPGVFTIVHVFGPAAGAHTIKGRWAALVGGTLSNPGTSRVIMVTEHKR